MKNTLTSQERGGICMIDLLVIVVVMSFLSFLFGHHIGEEAERKRRMK